MRRLTKLWILAVVLLVLLPLSYGLIECVPSGCPDGYTDNGVSCSGSTCKRSCTAKVCGTTWNEVYDDDTTKDSDSSGWVRLSTNWFDFCDNEDASSADYGNYKCTDTQDYCYEIDYTGYARSVGANYLKIKVTENSGDAFVPDRYRPERETIRDGDTYNNNFHGHGNDFYCVPRGSGACSFINDDDCFDTCFGYGDGNCDISDPEGECEAHATMWAQTCEDSDCDVDEDDSYEAKVRLEVNVAPLYDQSDDQTCQMTQCDPSDPCCDASGMFRPNTHICSEDSFKVDYGCPWGEGVSNLGADVGVRHEVRFCSGYSSPCSGNTGYSGYITHNYCGDYDYCVNDNPECQHQHQKPYITSKSASPSPVNEGDIITFEVSWNTVENTKGIMYIFKTDYYSEDICYSGAFADDKTVSCSYQAKSNDPSTFTYYAAVRDEEMHWSDVSQGTFEVNHKPHSERPTIIGEYGTDDNITCTRGNILDVDGPPLQVNSYQWYIDDQIVEGENNEKLDCHSVEGCDAGSIIKCSFNSVDGHGLLGDNSEKSNYTIIKDSPPVFVSNTALSSGFDRANEILEGENVTFSATINDPDKGTTKLIVCDDLGLSGTTCAGETYCVTRINETSDKSCRFDTSDMDSVEANWTSFVCDSDECTEGSSGVLYVDLIRPIDPELFVIENLLWSYSGEFIGSETVTGFEDILNDFLETCVPDSHGYCTIPLTFTSKSTGKIVVSDINIEYEVVNQPPVLEFMNNITVYEGDVAEINPVYSDVDNYNLIISMSEPVGDDGVWQTDHTSAGEYDIVITVSDGKAQDSQTVGLVVINKKLDLDFDGYDDDLESCPGTPSGEVVDSDGCSCSQLQVDDGNYCTTDICVDAVVSYVNNTDYSETITECPVDGCEGNNWVDYPDSGYGRCNEGSMIKYSCVPISSEYTDTCNEDDDGDGDPDVSDCEPNNPDVYNGNDDLMYNCVNDAPVITGPYVVVGWEGYTIEVNATAEDPDGDEVVFSYSGFITSKTYTPKPGDAGNYTMVLTADDGNGGITNKAIDVYIFEAPFADLVVKDVSYKPDSPRAGAPVMLRFVIENVGDYIAEGVEWAVVTGAVKASEQSDTFNLEPGEDFIGSALVLYDSAGEKSIQIVADGSDKIAEDDESNNAAEIAVLVG